MPSARAACDRRGDHGRFLVAEQPAFAGMRIEAGDGDARPRQAQAQRRRVGDADRLEHGVEGDRVDRLAQRQVDRHQHRAQLVVGQHHAHRRQRAARGRQRLQHLGVAGIGTPAAASASLWIGAVTMALASPRCTRRTACSMQRAAAARPQRASIRPSGAASEVGRQALDLQHRQAVGRHIGALRRDASSRATGSRPPTSAAAPRMTATSPTTNAARRLAALADSRR